MGLDYISTSKSVFSDVAIRTRFTFASYYCSGLLHAFRSKNRLLTSPLHILREEDFMAGWDVWANEYSTSDRIPPYIPTAPLSDSGYR